MHASVTVHNACSISAESHDLWNDDSDLFSVNCSCQIPTEIPGYYAYSNVRAGS